MRGRGLTDPTSGHLKLGCQESGNSYQKSSICVGLCQYRPQQEAPPPLGLTTRASWVGGGHVGDLLCHYFTLSPF